MKKYENIDIIQSLMDIINTTLGDNTFYKSYSKKKIREYAWSNNQDNKHLLFIANSETIHIENEYQVFIKGSGAYANFIETPALKIPNTVVLAMELTHIKDLEITGTIYELDYPNYIRLVKNKALPMNSIFLNNYNREKRDFQYKEFRYKTHKDWHKIPNSFKQNTNNTFYHPADIGKWHNTVTSVLKERKNNFVAADFEQYLDSLEQEIIKSLKKPDTIIIPSDLENPNHLIMPNKTSAPNHFEKKEQDIALLSDSLISIYQNKNMDVSEKNHELINTKKVPVISIWYAHYKNKLVFISNDEKVYIGDEKNIKFNIFTKKKYYNNKDSSLCFISDNKKMMDFLHKTSWGFSQEKLLDLKYTENDFIEYAKLRKGILSKYEISFEPDFDGKPFQSIEAVRKNATRIHRAEQYVKQEKDAKNRLPDNLETYRNVFHPIVVVPYTRYTDRVLLLGHNDKLYIGNYYNYYSRFMTSSGEWYDNSDLSLKYLSQNKKMADFICGSGWEKSQKDMLRFGLTMDDYDEYEILSNTVLKGLSIEEELFFDGKPFQPRKEFLEKIKTDISQTKQLEQKIILKHTKLKEKGKSGFEL